MKLIHETQSKKVLILIDIYWVNYIDGVYYTEWQEKDPQ